MKLMTGIGCILVMLAGLSQASTIAVQNSSFEDPSVGGWTEVNTASLTGWDVNVGYAALWNGEPGIGVSDGSQCLYISAHGADVVQTIVGVAQPNLTYTLQVDGFANEDTDTIVLLMVVSGTNDYYVSEMQLTKNAWVTDTLTMTLPSTIAPNSSLAIGIGCHNGGYGDTDASIDNVRLTSVPEPMTIGLLVMGGMMFFRKK